MAHDITIRGQEVTVQLVMNGVVQADSFAKMEEFTATANTDLVGNDYLGESLQIPDLQHHGWDFSFTMREQGRDVLDAYLAILDAEEESVPRPTVHVIITVRYRVATLDTVTVTIMDAALKLDDWKVSGRNEYVKSSWSGKARKITEV